MNIVEQIKQQEMEAVLNNAKDRGLESAAKVRVPSEIFKDKQDVIETLLTEMENALIKMGLSSGVTSVMALRETLKEQLGSVIEDLKKVEVEEMKNRD